MAKKETKAAEETAAKDIEQEEATAAEETTEAAAPEAAEPQASADTELEQLKQQAAEEHDAYLRLAAEYDNFRKRSQKEKDAIYMDAKADTAGKFLPVFDNLSRALEQPTEDEAYKKGVEMTMSGLLETMKALNIEVFGAVGDSFDPQMHNAVMHTEDESLGENVIAQVFQKGFRLGDKIIRFAMVQVAN